MRILVLVTAGILFTQLLAAQASFPAMPRQNTVVSTDSDSTLPELLGSIEINQDPRLEKLLKLHVDNNKRKEGMDGYRVEIFFSAAASAKEQALNRKKQFLARYPEYDVHIKYTAPNFRVRVGDFRTKNEALKLHKKIQDDFPGAFIVPDLIDFPLLKPKKYERPD